VTATSRWYLKAERTAGLADAFGLDAIGGEGDLLASDLNRATFVDFTLRLVAGRTHRQNGGRTDESKTTGHHRQHP